MLQSSPRPELSGNWDTFVLHVRQALENLYDPGRLQASPLIAMLGLLGAGEDTPAVILRELLRDAIEATRPDAALSLTRPEWQNYRLLSRVYLQSQNRYIVCEELGLSRSNYYRRLDEAVQAVAHFLAERARELAKISSDVATQVSPRKEALRMARQALHEAINLDTVLQDAVRLIRPLMEGQRLSLQIEIPEPLPMAFGDPAVLRQALLNLFTEALASAAGQALVLTVRAVGRETIWSLRGMRKLSQTTLEQTSGYSVSQTLLQSHGGRLWQVDDETGASLFFSLPVAKPPMILIVDDDADTVHLYRRYLEERAYIIKVAGSAVEAKTLLGECSPDLVLLDVLMPREDGWTVLEYLKSAPEFEAIPVIICSVLDQPRLALALGASTVLNKPVAEGALLQAVDTLLRG